MPETGGEGGTMEIGKVGEQLSPWTEGSLDIHFINTGRGESTFYVLPDGTTMLVDMAGSLLTTVAGLLVAIPSVFGFNFLTTQIRKMGVEIENFATSLSDRIEIEFAANYQAETERRREVKPEKAAVDNRQFWSSNDSIGKQAGLANAFNAGAPAAENASDSGDKILDFSLDDDSEEISNFDEE